LKVARRQAASKPALENLLKLDFPRVSIMVLQAAGQRFHPAVFTVGGLDALKSPVSLTQRISVAQEQALYPFTDRSTLKRHSREQPCACPPRRRENVLEDAGKRAPWHQLTRKSESGSTVGLEGQGWMLIINALIWCCQRCPICLAHVLLLIKTVKVRLVDDQLLKQLSATGRDLL
jgi:hypothetical protein